jgi:hypothetical protein
MKTVTQIKFEEVVKHCFHDTLKPLKFIKKAYNFYRNVGEVGHIINVQKSLYGSKDDISFTANIGIFSPLYWRSEYNFKGDPAPPTYPTEPVCAIRLRLGQFVKGYDKWYDIQESTDTQAIITEISDAVKNKVTPFFDAITNHATLVDYVENEYRGHQATFIKFVLYGELGMRRKLEEIYPVLLQESTKLQHEHIKARAVRYQLTGTS